MDTLKNIHPAYFEQLTLALDLPEEEITDLSGAVSPEEQRRRALAAERALELLIEGSHALPEGEGETVRPGWYETYRELRRLNWPWRVACYIAWAASPKVGRWPKSQEELAQQVLGLTSDRVITTWRKKSPEINEIISLLQAAPMLEHRADVIKALAESASKPDYKHNPDRKLFLEMTGDYVPRSKVDLGREPSEDLSDRSEAELRRLAQAVVKRKESDGEAETGAH